MDGDGEEVRVNDVVGVVAMDYDDEGDDDDDGVEVIVIEIETENDVVFSVTTMILVVLEVL